MDETIAGGAPEPASEPGETGDTMETTTSGATGDPDIDSSLRLIVASFPDEVTAEAAFNEIKEAEKQELILLVDAAIVNRDEGNNLHVKDEQDWTGRVGALLGGGIGTILGAIGGPLGLVVGGAAGAAIGAAAAARSDAGMSDERLKEFASTLKPGTSMVIVVVARLWRMTTEGLLARAGGEVNSIPLTDDIAQQLHLPQKRS